MRYKIIEKQVEAAKELADSYQHIQAHQDIYQEHLEVLKKAKSFDEVTELYEKKEEMYSNEFVEELGYILKKYEEDK